MNAALSARQCPVRGRKAKRPPVGADRALTGSMNRSSNTLKGPIQ